MRQLILILGLLPQFLQAQSSLSLSSGFGQGSSNFSSLTESSHYQISADFFRWSPSDKLELGPYLGLREDFITLRSRGKYNHMTRIDSVSINYGISARLGLGSQRLMASAGLLNATTNLDSNRSDSSGNQILRLRKQAGTGFEIKLQTELAISSNLYGILGISHTEQETQLSDDWRYTDTSVVASGLSLAQRAPNTGGFNLPSRIKNQTNALYLGLSMKL